ncbi:MAG: hypothetical protein JWN17_824, partial [Frankiales bacterium]|nr:hypothetical protein [Frankiales bacterium]
MPPARDLDAGPSVKDVLGVAVVVVLVLLRSRRRRRARARAAADPPTVPAVAGRTSAVEPLDRLPVGPVPPGRPRLAPVHAGSV